MTMNVLRSEHSPIGPIGSGLFSTQVTSEAGIDHQTLRVLHSKGPLSNSSVTDQTDMMFMTSSPVAVKAMTLRQPLYQQKLNQAPTFSQCKSPKDQIEILIGELKSKRV